jgi:hypothetical protein
MIFCLLVIFLSLSVVNAGTCFKKSEPNTYSRTVVGAKDILNFTSAESRVIDPNGTRTKAFLGLTDADIQEQRDKAFARFKNRFGIDVYGTGVYYPASDQWVVPYLGVVLPYGNGDDLHYRITYDSCNADVEKFNSHIEYQWGYLLQFTGNGTVNGVGGTFPGGIMAGKHYVIGDHIGATQVVWLDLRQRENWNNPSKCDWTCRDTNDCGSTIAARMIPSPYAGWTEVYGTRELHNRHFNVTGWYTTHVVPVPLDDGSTSVQYTRSVITLNDGLFRFRLPY